MLVNVIALFTFETVLIFSSNWPGTHCSSPVLSPKCLTGVWATTPSLNLPSSLTCFVLDSRPFGVLKQVLYPWTTFLTHLKFLGERLSGQGMFSYRGEFWTEQSLETVFEQKAETWGT